MSISDLMTALCALFALVMIVFASQLNEEREKLKLTANELEARTSQLNEEREKLKLMTGEYVSLKDQLARKLYNEFAKDLEVWNAEIDYEKGIIKFNDSEVLFNPEEAELKERYKEILSDFFPRLIGLLVNPEFEFMDEIKEIRIEGHTARDNNMEEKLDYITGMILSQERTTNTMLYCLETVPVYREWVQKKIAAIGYSNSHSTEDKKTSRRVEFRIDIKAEEKIKQIDSVMNQD